RDGRRDRAARVRGSGRLSAADSATRRVVRRNSSRSVARRRAILRDMNLLERLGIELPIIQAPMAGSQGSALAIAVSNAGGLGSQPCAMLSVDGMCKELATIRAATQRPFGVNFFCHSPPREDAGRDAAWRTQLAPFYRDLGVDPNNIPKGAPRRPFDAEYA